MVFGRDVFLLHTVPEEFDDGYATLDEVKSEAKIRSCSIRLPGRRTYWSKPSSTKVASGFMLINEAATEGSRPIVDGANKAAYIHVDDGVFVADAPEGANKAMHSTADELEAQGFTLVDSQECHSLQKIVGYQIIRSPAGLRYPRYKSAKLEKALNWLASNPVVDVDTLRALVGIWVFGALIRRELLSVLGHVFTFIEKHGCGLHRWWASARREVHAMAALVVYMRIDLTAPAAGTLFATDARGADEHGDAGGYGIVARDFPMTTVMNCWRSSMQPGRSIASLDGRISNKLGKPTALVPTVPFTRLPAELFSQPWTILDQGVWRMRDHITAGEARAHFRCVQGLAADHRTHGFRLLFLEDNEPVASCLAKGRATSSTLNFYCRRRAAHSLAARFLSLCPWAQSKLMPADAASRAVSQEGDEAPVANGPSGPRPAHQGPAYRWLSQKISDLHPALPRIHHWQQVWLFGLR